jgi:hypothetical protein
MDWKIQARKTLLETLEMRMSPERGVLAGEYLPQPTSIVTMYSGVKGVGGLATVVRRSFNVSPRDASVTWPAPTTEDVLSPGA